jgi:hypothetical protein
MINRESGMPRLLRPLGIEPGRPGAVIEASAMAYAIARVLTRSKRETHPVSDKRWASAMPTSSGQLSGSKSVRTARLDSAGRASDGRQAQPYVSMGSRQQGHRSTKAVTSLSNRRSDIPRSGITQVT